MSKNTLCFLFRIHSMFFSTICFSDIFCSKVAKWPNLSNLKNRENDSGSIPPFALPSDARRKKGKQAVLRPRRAAWPYSILLENACRVYQRDISWLVACHLCFWWNVLAHHDYVEIKGLRLATGLYYFKAYMRCDLLLSHCSGNEGRAGQLTWISENSEKSVCCRFNGFLLWIVGSLVKQMPKDSWIVSYENCRSACKMVHRDIPMSWFSQPCHSRWNKPFRMVHGIPTLRLAECATEESTKGLQRRSGCSQIWCGLSVTARLWGSCMKFTDFVMVFQKKSCWHCNLDCLNCRRCQMLISHPVGCWCWLMSSMNGVLVP